MGIFGSIKKSFNDAVLWLKNTRNLNEKFIPYFNEREKFTTLSKIDESIDDDITRIYQEIKSYNPTKYTSEISRYEQFLSKVKEHNKIIDIINNGMKEFNYRSFIDYPFEHNICELNKFMIIVDKIKLFSNMDEVYINFCKKVLEIEKNFEAIKLQFSLLDLYKETFDFTGYRYIDILEKNKLLNKIPLFSRLSSCCRSLQEAFSVKKAELHGLFAFLVCPVLAKAFRRMYSICIIIYCYDCNINPKKEYGS